MDFAYPTAARDSAFTKLMTTDGNFNTVEATRRSNSSVSRQIMKPKGCGSNAKR